jgi:hypothetical protein
MKTFEQNEAELIKILQTKLKPRANAPASIALIDNTRLY